MPLIIALILAAFMGVAMMPSAEREANLAVAAKRESAATKVVAYLDAVRQYRMDNPATTGSISDLVITMPSGTTKPATWGNVIYDGRLWVYEQTASYDMGLLSALGDQEARNGVFVGSRTGASLTTTASYATAITFPAGIPAGAIVMVTR